MMPLEGMDPSLSIGLYFRSKTAFFEFVTEQKAFEAANSYHIFTIAPTMPDYLRASPPTAPSRR